MSKQSIFVDRTKKLHPYVKEGGHLVKESQAGKSFDLGVNVFEGFRRFGIKTGQLSGSAVLDGQNVEIQVDGNNGGYTDRQWIEIETQELGGTNPATINYQLLFKDTEIYINGKKKKFHTILPEEYGYLHFIDLPFEELRKIRIALGIDADYRPTANNLAAGTKRKFYIEIPIWRGTPFDQRHILNGITYKFNFNAATVFSNSGAGLSQNIAISSLNILCRQINIPQIQIPSGLPLHHKYINWVRNSENFNMTASNFYDFDLKSLNGLCSHLVIMFRTASPIGNYANYNTFLGNIEKVKLQYNGGVDIGLEFTKEMSNYILGPTLNSDFLVTHPTGSNVFLIPFNMIPSSAHAGFSFGNFNFTTKEILRIYTNSAFTSASVTVDCWAAMYAHFSIDSVGEFNSVENV